MHRPLLAGMAGAVVIAGSSVGFAISSAAGAPPELARIEKDSLTDQRRPLPTAALQVFTYEGAPRSIHVTREGIAVAYERSGVLFDRASGAVKRRLTVKDGWPENRPPYFAAAKRHRPKLLGPGVAEDFPNLAGGRDDDNAPVTVASAEFGGKTWRALQPRNFLQDLRRNMDFSQMRRELGAWTPILQRLHEVSYIEVTGNGANAGKRYTTREGLAGNIVTHLVVTGGTVWAACVDIYDPGKKDWGSGGLCRFNSKSGQWERLDRIGGRPVRWVTLLQAIGDELWVGYCEGEGVVGDHITYGMGTYPDDYRPKMTALVLARLKNGQWSRFVRSPRIEKSPPRYSREDEAKAATEKPRILACVAW